MKRYPIKSARGVYYDLTVSPYEFINSYGEVFKFSSGKKLEIYKREHERRIAALTKTIDKIRSLVGISFEIDKAVILALEIMLYKDIEK